MEVDLWNRVEKKLYSITNPERYTGNEWNIIKKDWDDHDIKVALAFPDVYEIGMSHLGLKIIYHLLNQDDDILCERSYAPWIDMEELMRTEKIPLFTLENKRSIRDFDIFGFTLQYEMSYTNILNMLDLAEIPLHSEDRSLEFPLIIAGGSTVFNPEPLTPFIDLFYMGEAEAGIKNLVRKYIKLRDTGYSKDHILKEMSSIPGVYVPGLYNISYSHKGAVSEFSCEEGIKEKIKKQLAVDLNHSFYPTDFIVPYMDIVHDRAVLEISRGCTGGCRFCAAGMAYRPVRERSPEKIMELADKILDSTGYQEISLSSLSTADYSRISELIRDMSTRYEGKKVSIALPSLRVDKFSVNLAREVQRVRKSGLTFAPEAGTQRLRDVINKGVDENELYEAVTAAFNEGWSTIKLYFMIGLPTETKEDLKGIAKLAGNVLKIGRDIRRKKKARMRPIRIHVSVSTFIPKPFTPFQWVRMDKRQEIIEKQKLLQKEILGRGLNLSWNEVDLSLLEGVFSRGDRRLAPVLESAWKKGCRFEGWNDQFDFQKWLEAFDEHDLTIQSYLRKRDPEETLPWDHVDMGITKEFLKKEYKKALKGEKTDDCRKGKCSNCNVCFELETKMQLVGGKKDVD